VVNFAAESHVDRSLHEAADFIRTNIQGTLILLEAARRRGVRRFVQVSTDEVYGSLGPEGLFTESSPIAPTSPYAVSKASADLLALSMGRNLGVEVVVARSSNNYGPNQHPEKFIPLFITNALEDKACPLYGDGKNVRDWLFVHDNVRAIQRIVEKGRAGEAYNIAGNEERANVDVARTIMKILGKPESLITLVKDRPGHDRRYALDASKIDKELDVRPSLPFEVGLKTTIDWYVKNRPWWEPIRSSNDYKEHTRRTYGAS
jgi:dTDP-glucose 4,6-dehydratase